MGGGAFPGRDSSDASHTSTTDGSRSDDLMRQARRRASVRARSRRPRLILPLPPLGALVSSDCSLSVVVALAANALIDSRPYPGPRCPRTRPAYRLTFAASHELVALSGVPLDHIRKVVAPLRVRATGVTAWVQSSGGL
jgi:hypothetical protein